MLSQATTDSKSSLISGATVTICHRDTHLNNLTWHCKNADLVISAVGRAKLVQHCMIKEGAVVIDVGISKSWTDKAVANKKCFVGDVDFDEVKRVARWITPVPGGVGPITVACLVSNLLELARQRQKNKYTTGYVMVSNIDNKTIDEKDGITIEEDLELSKSNYLKEIVGIVLSHDTIFHDEISRLQKFVDKSSISLYIYIIDQNKKDSSSFITLNYAK
ncbi:unnamed protein product [Rotaria socialis]|uniref:methenyltetrahydrofolate cyclohydrolase n=1 Tax=Rotaria socialis TaxID=392032 RepID=A0A821LCP6_9BILA|nr:unnamed protein product [Rotaria socialis]